MKIKFLALKPSSASLSTIKSFDEKVSFISFVPFSLKGFADSDEVASLSLESSRKLPKHKLIRKIKWYFLRCQYNWSRHYFERHKENTVALCWNGLNSSRRTFVEGAKRAGAATVFFETSPLPHRITIDRQGVNYFNSLPRNIDFYQEWQRQNPNLLDDWKKTRKFIVSRKANDNKNVRQERGTSKTMSKPYLFIPLQVQNDSQIRLFGGLVDSVYAFVEILNEYAGYLPEDWTLRIKEHPSSREPYYLEKYISSNKIIIDNITDTMSLVKQSEGVITINSSVGLEALFFEKPVLIFGQAFYGFSPLVFLLEKKEDIKKVFTQPRKYFNYDAQSVVPFLNYLSCEYYPKVEVNNGEVKRIDAHWLQAFKENLLKDILK